jgi:hypothetical protein
LLFFYHAARSSYQEFQMTKSRSKNVSRTTTTSKKACTKVCPKSWTATEIAQSICDASTAGEKAAATRRLNNYVQSRVATGADGSRVESNIRSISKRLGRG